MKINKPSYCYPRLLFAFCCLFTGGLLASNGARAQEPYAINYSIGEGLPSSNIYSVFQEKNGTLWFTSDVGIVKYNSKNFQLFNTDNGLSDNEVFRLREDHAGRIWMQTVNGRPCYIKDHRIYNETNSPLLKKLKGIGFIIDLYEDDQQNVYLLFRNGQVYVVDKQDEVKSIATQENNLIGIWKDDHVYLHSGQFIYDVSSGKKMPNQKPGAYRFYHDGAKTFVSDMNNIYVPKGSQLVPLLQADAGKDIINFKEEGTKYWLCTRSGLTLYEGGHYRGNYFSDCVVSDMIKDFEGNYWITTLNKGVLFVPSFQINQLLGDKKINCITAKNDDEMWAGGVANDIYIMKNCRLTQSDLPADWRKDKVSNIRFFGDTAIIISKVGIELRRATASSYLFLNGNDLITENGFYYLATNYTAKIKRSDFDNSRRKMISQNALLKKRSNVLCADRSNNIWIGTNYGLHRYNETDSIVNLGEKMDDLSISIEDLFFDQQNRLLLVATASKGIVMLQDGNFYKKFSSLDGLNSNTVNVIRKIGEGAYLVGSNNGLNKITLGADSAAAEVVNYNAYLGIKNKKITDIELLHDTVYLATDYGLLYFSLNYLGNTTIRPRCLINELNAVGKTAGNTIAYANNNVSISYSGISFRDLGDVKYFYKLQPQDAGWQETKETQINYNSLAAGRYTFTVYCVNSLGQKSEVQKIDFEILPPFWQKLWFRVLMLLAGICLLYLFIRLRLKQEKKRFAEERNKISIERDKARLEKQMVELEQKALRMQMNPHFIFNGLNTIKGYYAEGNFVNASAYISKFSRLLRKLLESEEQVTTLDNEIEMLQLYVELTQIRYAGKFEYRIHVAEDIQQDVVLIPNLLLQPLVENAIIHGLSPKKEKGNLLIDFRLSGELLICTVEDDGIGREAAAKNQSTKTYQSKAIDITRERLALFDAGSRMEIRDKETISGETGTLVTITIPVKYL